MNNNEKKSRLLECFEGLLARYKSNTDPDEAKESNAAVELFQWACKDIRKLKANSKQLLDLYEMIYD